MRTETLEINGVRHPVRIFIEKRDNAAASVGRRFISLHLPAAMSREELCREMLRMKSWARQKILESPERFRPEERKTYADGQELAVGDQKYVLRIGFREKASSSARIDGNRILLSVSSGLSDAQKHRHISTLLSRCIAGKRLPGLQERIEALNARHFGRKIGRVSFKHQKSTWGSCSELGNINISTRLLFAPDDVLDYICIHELAHLAEHNHSDRFWALVEKAMPDYREKKKWLRENGKACGF